MARKGKNDNLKDTAREQEGRRPARKRDAAATTDDCGHSIGLMPHLTEEISFREPKAMAVDSLTVLRRLYKKMFGYKPVGKSAQEIEQVLRSRGVDPWG